VLFGLFGLVLGLLGTILWLALVGFLIYLVLKIFAPDTAARVREMVAGR
jgi:O-antigen ligase